MLKLKLNYVDKRDPWQSIHATKIVSLRTLTICTEWTNIHIKITQSLMLLELTDELSYKWYITSRKICPDFKMASMFFLNIEILW